MHAGICMGWGNSAWHAVTCCQLLIVVSAACIKFGAGWRSCQSALTSSWHTHISRHSAESSCSRRSSEGLCRGQQAVIHCLMAFCRGDRMLCSFPYRLDQALAQYFGEATGIAEQEEVYPAMPVPIRKCPQCNNDMVLKTKRNGGSVTFFIISYTGGCFLSVHSPSLCSTLENLGYS